MNDQKITLPEYHMVAGETQILIVPVYSTTGRQIDATGMTAKFAITDFLFRDSNPIVTKDCTIVSGNSTSMRVLRVQLDPEDTIDIYGKYVYQFTATDDAGSIYATQGSIFVYSNADSAAFGLVPVALTNISVAYSGGDVPNGTDVNDLTGIVVTAHYADGSSAEVTEYALSGVIVRGDNIITVSYEDKTTTFVVVGLATLTSISATYSGGNVPIGTAVADLTGVSVVASYSDGSTKNVTGYTLTGTISAGKNTVTVTYEGKKATFSVTGAYVWEKYSVATANVYGLSESTNKTSLSSNNLSPSSPAYKTVSVDSSTGEITLSDIGGSISTAYKTHPYAKTSSMGSFGSGGGTYRVVSATNPSSSFWAYSAYRIDAVVIDTTDIRGDYIESVMSTTNRAYPNNGIQNGYWYVKVT